MSEQSVFYVGTLAEIGHHAEPLSDALPLKTVTADQVVELARPGDLAIFFSEHFHRFRKAIGELRERNVATLYAIDGILEWRNAWENRPDEPASPFTMRPVLSHKVACIGRSQARILRSWGNQGQIEVVGLPRLDSLRSRKPRSAGDTFRLLITSAKWPGFTEKQVANAVTGFTALREWIDAHPEVEGRRIEPCWRLTEGLAEKVGVENQLRDVRGSDLASCLADADAMITMPSTAMLEGMLQGIPVALLEFNLCPRYVPAAWEINRGDSIGEVIRELASPAESKMSYQETLLHDTLELGESATERMVKLCEEMLGVARACVEKDQTVSFPPQILDGPMESSAEATGFDHTSIYPQHEALAEQDLVTLQIALADANRELDQRQARIEQLEKELGQAHEIFDEINQHPVAGPIVRARQRLIDWWGNRKDRASSSKSSPPPNSPVGRTS